MSRLFVCLTGFLFVVSSALAQSPATQRTDCYHPDNPAIRIECPKEQPRSLRVVDENAVRSAAYCDIGHAVRAGSARSTRSLLDEKVTFSSAFKNIRSKTDTLGAQLNGIPLQPFELGLSGSVSQTQYKEQDLNIGPGPLTVKELLAQCVNVRNRAPDTRWLAPLTREIESMLYAQRGRITQPFLPRTLTTNVKVTSTNKAGVNLKFIFVDLSTNTQVDVSEIHTVTVGIDLKAISEETWWVKECSLVCIEPTGLPIPAVSQPIPPFEDMKLPKKEQAVGVCKRHGFATASIISHGATFTIVCSNIRAMS